MNKEQYLRELKEERDTYSDEIPKGILHSSGDPKFKVRKGWFQGFVAYVEMGMDGGFVDEESEKLYQDFWKHVGHTNFCGRLTTREDIEKASSILTNIINHLEKRVEHS